MIDCRSAPIAGYGLGRRRMTVALDSAYDTHALRFRSNETVLFRITTAIVRTASVTQQDTRSARFLVSEEVARAATLATRPRA